MVRRTNSLVSIARLSSLSERLGQLFAHELSAHSSTANPRDSPRLADL
ncbi:hypothetical protein HSB1_16260 [Halogranum salarium B-1]|uniref:Uncharacterized protein n=1 Tax=Halogranum salarium B-1 TaxID=1210908 RepID=J3A2B1_9EURY|nr:hypothetical protein HSB1_16260 [Halogranum salarium B-1]